MHRAAREKLLVELSGLEPEVRAPAARGWTDW